jgi:Family of unknown function (DUF5990)
MRIVIEGHDLPGAEFVSEGVPLHNVHVAVQVGKEPVGLVRGDANSARWEIDVHAVVADVGSTCAGRQCTARRASDSSTSRGATSVQATSSPCSAGPS